MKDKKKIPEFLVALTLFLPSFVAGAFWGSDTFECMIVATVVTPLAIIIITAFFGITTYIFLLPLMIILGQVQVNDDGDREEGKAYILSVLLLTAIFTVVTLVYRFNWELFLGACNW